MSEARLTELSPVRSSDQPAAEGLAENLCSVGMEIGLPPEPELKLMAMILEDAITCYLRYGSAKSEAGRREHRAAERWLFSRDRDWIFSFENICHHLGVDPDFARQRIRDGRLKSSLGRRRQSNNEENDRVSE